MYYLILENQGVDCFSYDQSIIELAQSLRGGEIVFSEESLSDLISKYIRSGDET